MAEVSILPHGEQAEACVPPFVPNEWEKHYHDKLGRKELLTRHDEQFLFGIVGEGRTVKTRLQDEQRDPSEAERSQLDSAKRARDMVFHFNQGLVYRYAFRSNIPQGLEPEDLIQQGNIGLAYAIDRFDPTLGYKFATYARLWIVQAVDPLVSKHKHTLYVPPKAERKAATDYRNGQAAPLPDESSALSAARRPLLYLDARLSDSSDMTHGETLSDPRDPIEELLTRLSLHQVIDALPPDIADDLNHVYGLRGSPRLTYREIGARTGRSERTMIRHVARAHEELGKGLAVYDAL